MKEFTIVTSYVEFSDNNTSCIAHAIQCDETELRSELASYPINKIKITIRWAETARPGMWRQIDDGTVIFCEYDGNEE